LWEVDGGGKEAEGPQNPVAYRLWLIKILILKQKKLSGNLLRT
jgi:hypothetical protein